MWLGTQSTEVKRICHQRNVVHETKAGENPNGIVLSLGLRVKLGTVTWWNEVRVDISLRGYRMLPARSEIRASILRAEGNHLNQQWLLLDSVLLSGYGHCYFGNDFSTYFKTLHPTKINDASLTWRDCRLWENFLEIPLNKKVRKPAGWTAEEI